METKLILINPAEPSDTDSFSLHQDMHWGVQMLHSFSLRGEDNHLHCQPACAHGPISYMTCDLGISAMPTRINAGSENLEPQTIPSFA